MTDEQAEEHHGEGKLASWCKAEYTQRSTRSATRPKDPQEQQHAHHTRPGGTKRTRADRSKLPPAGSCRPPLPPAHSVLMRTVKPPWQVTGPSGCRSMLPALQAVVKGGEADLEGQESKANKSRARWGAACKLLPGAQRSAVPYLLQAATKKAQHSHPSLDFCPSTCTAQPAMASRHPPGALPDDAVVRKVDVRWVQQVLQQQLSRQRQLALVPGCMKAQARRLRCSDSAAADAVTDGADSGSPAGTPWAVAKHSSEV